MRASTCLEPFQGKAVSFRSRAPQLVGIARNPGVERDQLPHDIMCVALPRSQSQQGPKQLNLAVKSELPVAGKNLGITAVIRIGYPSLKLMGLEKQCAILLEAGGNPA